MGASAPAPAGTSLAEAPGLPPALPDPPDPPALRALPARPCQAVPHPEAPRPEARPGSQAAGPAEHGQRASGASGERRVNPARARSTDFPRGLVKFT